MDNETTDKMPVSEQQTSESFDKCLQRFSLTKWVLELLCFAGGIDIFIVYKRRYGLRYDLTHLQLPFDERDKKLDRYLLVRSVYFGLLSVKYLMLSGLHFCILKLDRIVHDNNQNKTPTIRLLNFIWDFARIFDSSIDMKSSQIHSMSSVFYALLAILLAAICALPYHHRKISPFDWISLRFLIRPKHELKRLELLLNQKLDLDISSIDRLSIQISKEFAQISSVRPEIRSVVRRLLSRIVTQRRMTTRYKTSHKHNALPSIYSLGWFQQCYRVIGWLIVVLMVNLSFFCWISCCLMISVLLESQCKINVYSLVQVGDQVCTEAVPLEWGDYMLLIEQVICCVVVFMSFLILEIAILVQMATHLKMTYSLKTTLNDYIFQSRNMMESWLEQTCESSRRPNPDPLDNHLDSVLLESLAKLRIYEHDISNSTRTISRLVTVVLDSGVGSIVLMCLGAGSRKGLESWFDLIALMWLVMNVFVVIGAALQAEVSSLKKIIASVVAETTHRSLLLTGRSPPNDSLAILWRKLAANQNLMDEIRSIKCHGIRITFSLLLEANILVFSIAVLFATK